MSDEPSVNPYQLQILLGLNKTGKHVYAGTVEKKTVEQRRRANRIARASRQKNRRG